MLYTLLKFLGWGLLLAVIGGCIGWALRSLTCRNEIAQARSATVDTDDVERMRHRLANLEQVVAERDRLRIQLADVRHADSPGIVGAPIPEADPVTTTQPDDGAAEPDIDESATEQDESTRDDAATERSADDLPADPDDVRDDETDRGEAASDGTGSDGTGAAAADDTVDSDTVDSDAVVVDADVAAAPDLDLGAASAVLGKKIELDDLTVVEGIGPKISELCSGIGITTWRRLADTDVADLQSMLDAAGSRYTVHKPGTWPQQAELLATGRWEEFTALTDELGGGR